MNFISKLSLIAALSSSAVAFAGTRGSPNCDVGGKKVHVKDKAQCDKKKGSFLEEKATEVKAAVKPVEPVTEHKVDEKAAPAPETKK